MRELRNAVEHLYVMRGDAAEFNVSHLPRRIQPQRALPPQAAGPLAGNPASISDEAAQLAQLLDRHGWDVEGKKHAAQALGIGIATLYRKLRQHGIGKR